MNVLITGGAGFIGSNLVRYLINSNKEIKITVVDNLYTGNLNNIQKFIDDGLVEFINHDIRIPFQIDGPIDVIYNLACPASPPHYQKDPIFTLDTSVLGIKNILDIAKKYNSTVIQASTSEIYGDPLVHPQSESYWGNVNTLGVRSCYDEGKRVAESYCFEYWKEYDVDVRIVRIFNTYGPYMDPKDGRVISNFINQMIRNEDITMYGDGTQTRSFQYVDDLILGFHHVLSSPRISKDLFDKPYVFNIGNPDEFTLIELVSELRKLIPESTSNIVYKELPKDDPQRRKPDISKMKSYYSWSPIYYLKYGLIKTINYFKYVNQSNLQ